jgi:hypothetical protein
MSARYDVRERPQTLMDYQAWLRSIDPTVDVERERTYYESVSNVVLTRFRESEFWKATLDRCSTWDQEYHIETGYGLFQSTSPPEVLAKPFMSVLDKAYRKNVVENRNPSSPPRGGWVLPATWWSQLNDLVRTVFSVKYLDGVETLANRLLDLGSEYSLAADVSLEARLTGYYAGHAYVSFPVEIPRRDWDTERVTVKVELQITTQLQDVIRKLLHRHYATSRSSTDRGNKWMWDYQSDEFASNYLGHILHYVEGMIMEVRSKQKGQLS